MNRETDEEYDRRQHAVYWARENKRAAAEQMYEALKLAHIALKSHSKDCLGCELAEIKVEAALDKAAPAVTEDELEGK